MLKLLIKSIAQCLLAISLTATVQAHPHNWIDLHSSFLLDDQGNLTEIKQRWQFDTFYSLMTLADLANEYGSEEMGLPIMAQTMVDNLQKVNYFSSLKLADSSVSMGIPDDYSLIKTSKDEQTIIELEMVFKLDKSLAVKNKTLFWQVFDPTYYVSMAHIETQNIEIVGGEATNCSKELVVPKPSAELIEYAMSLDVTMKDTDGLGIKFAEQTIIHC